MASIEGRRHGGKRENSGRKTVFASKKEAKKAWSDNRKRIYLKNSIFTTWKEAKCEAGYAGSSDSDFAAHLLSLEYRRL